MIARRMIVRGAVQGVGYRYALIDAAQTLDVTGWVRNRRDGSVEAFVQGDTDAVSRLINWARTGPPAARVADFEVLEAEPDRTLRDFGLRATV